MDKKRPTNGKQMELRKGNTQQQNKFRKNQPKLGPRKNGNNQQGHNKPATTPINVRRLAVQALVEIERNKAYANLVLQHYISEHVLTDVNRRFLTELVYGVVRRKNYLDAIIVGLTKRPLKKLSPLAHQIIRLGLYQIIYLDKVPESAAVNESVKLAKKMIRGLEGFVNGVLRNYLRNTDSFTIDELAHSETERLAYIYNQPTWLLERWLKEYGEESTIGLCEWFNTSPRLTARVNTLKTTTEAVVEEMRAAQWIVEVSDKLDTAIYIDRHMGPIDESKWFKEGLITFADLASMMVAFAVAPKAGDSILDCCAAPGGKSMHMASLMDNKGQVIANDLHEHKLALMENNARRLGLTNVSFSNVDATDLPEKWYNQFDKVLADVPCSGLGILQRKLDMRWEKEEEQLDRLPSLQLEILNSAAKTVKPGGILVYSTCTINKKENEDVIQEFLHKHTEFVLEDAAPLLPFIIEGPMINLWPTRHNMDGFFMARLRKKEI